LSKTFIITFQPDGKRVEIKEDQSVLDGAILNGIDITSICGGLGNCGKCKIVLPDHQQVNAITDKEKKLLTKGEITNGVRLACQTKLKGNIVVKIPEYSRTGKQRLQVEGIETPIELNPSVRKYYIEMEKPTIHNIKSDLDRLYETLQTQCNLTNLQIHFNVLQELGHLIRDSEFKMTVVIWDDEIIAIEPFDTTRRLYGYAVDIGTTKLAGYLIDLTTAKVIGAGSAMNPQIPFGEDVISRVNHPNPQLLHEAVVQGINKILDNLIEKTGVQNTEIYEMTTVGNTIMHHLFLNIYPRFVGLSPYPPVARDSIVVDNRVIGIDIHPNAKIYFLPLVAGYVGADTVAVILATEIYKKEQEINLTLDIGTNTEVVLGNKDQLYVCSCASGPAFEGAHMRYGMRAASGAIERIKIDPNTLKLTYKTIDNEPAKGICGSAFIDLLSEMLKAGFIDVKGKFNKNLKNERLRAGPNGWELVIAPASESATQEDITFTQKDMQQLILAKAAMQTGVLTLLHRLNIPKEQITHVFIAGAFGSHVTKTSARNLGIIPEIPLDKIHFVGNAAGTGARMCLVSRQAKNIVEAISKQVHYIELAADENFQNTFLNSNFIPYSDLSEYPELSAVLRTHGNYPEKPPHIFKIK